MLTGTGLASPTFSFAFSANSEMIVSGTPTYVVETEINAPFAGRMIVNFSGSFERENDAGVANSFACSMYGPGGISASNPAISGDLAQAEHEQLALTGSFTAAAGLNRIALNCYLRFGGSGIYLRSYDITGVLTGS
ncbi:unannotated protein [freshwater metagenome]|uniref:Unannotated protein n=1 Tax=freshwater metagenome TaxID=449393 RepID=A0A6J7JA94_9ZZZZ|nr:hypothetical protein [Actinomycetota bacterium]